MVRLQQNVEAAFEAESSYGDPPATSLSHLGLLDTFDPRAVEMAIAAVPSIGQSTEPFHAEGPINVTLPLKVACQGDGWKHILGRAIGSTATGGSVSGSTPHALTSTVNSLAILARENGVGYTLATGVVPNEVTLEADYTTGGILTLDAQCTAFYTQDSTADNANFSDDSNPTAFLVDNYSAVSFPAGPTTEPLLPTDLTVSVGLAAATKGITPNGGGGTNVASYIEVGERYMRIYQDEDSLDGIHSDGIIDLTSATDAQNTTEGVKVLIAADGQWSCTRESTSTDSVNLLKGIYNFADNAGKTIYAVDDMAGTFPNLKTLALKIANNNTPIAGTTTRNGVTKWLANNAIGRGLSNVTLDLTMTAEDETYYDIYKAGTTIPLIRLDFGTHGSIALTNGTITAFSRPLTGGTEIVDTMTIKFRGAGDYKNFSAFAISADWSL